MRYCNNHGKSSKFEKKSEKLRIVYQIMKMRENVCVYYVQ